MTKQIFVVSSDADILNLFDLLNRFISFKSAYNLQLFDPEQYKDGAWPNIPKNIDAVLIDEYSEPATTYFVKKKPEIDSLGVSLGHIVRYDYSAEMDYKNILRIHSMLIPTPEYVKEFLDGWLKEIEVEA